MRRAVLAVLCSLSVLAPLLVTAGPAIADGGSTRWTASYQAGAPAVSNAVALSSDGSTVFVTGLSNFGPTGRFATLAYDAVTGHEDWVDGFPGPASGQYGAGKVLATSRDGSTLFVGGYSRCSTGCTAALRGLHDTGLRHATGDRRWVHGSQLLVVRPQPYR